MTQFGFDPSKTKTRSGLKLIRSETNFSIQSALGPALPQQAAFILLLPRLSRTRLIDSIRFKFELAVVVAHVVE